MKINMLYRRIILLSTFTLFVLAIVACYDGIPFPDQGLNGQGEDIITITEKPEGTMEGPGEIKGKIDDPEGKIKDGTYKADVLVDGKKAPGIKINIDDDGNFSIEIDPKELDLEPGEHTITVQITDENGNVIDEEEVVIVIGEIEAPTITVTKPTDKEKVSGLTFITGTAKDPDGTVAKIQIVDEKGNIIQEYTDKEDFNYPFDTSKKEDGTYTWKIIATDNAGNVSEKEFTFEIDNSGGTTGTPPTVSFVQPTENQTVSGTKVDVIANITKGDSEVTKVEMIVDCGSPASQELTVGTMVVGSYDSTACSDGVHKIIIKVTDANGNVVTEEQTVVVSNGSGDPTIPSAAGPPNGATDICDNTPEVSWSTVADAISYELYIDSDGSNGTPDYPPTADYDGTNTNFQVSSSLADGTYFWKVRAKFSGSNGDWSNDYYFTVKADLDSPDTLAHTVPPSYGDTTCATAEVQITWNPSTNADSHTLEIATDSNNFDTTIVVTETNATSPYTTTFGDTNDKYYRITAKRSDLGGGCEDVVMGASKIEFITNSISDITSMTATTNCSNVDFSWAVTGATECRITVDDDNNFGSPEINNVVTTNTNSHQITSGLTPGTAYYWKIKASNGDGCYNEVTAGGTFTLNSYAEPTPGAVNTTACPAGSESVTFNWTKATGATGYRITVYSDAYSTVVTTIDVADVNNHVANLSTFGTTSRTCYWRLEAKHGTCYSVMKDGGDFDISYLTEPATLDLTATTNNDDVEFSWNDWEGESGYTIQYVESSKAYTDTSMVEITSASSPKSATSLDSGTYKWRLKATNGYSCESAWKDGSTFTITSVLTEVYSMEAYKACGENFRLDFSGSSGQTYIVHIATDAGFTTNHYTATAYKPYDGFSSDYQVTSEDFTTATFNASTTYYWKVEKAGVFTANQNFTTSSACAAGDFVGSSDIKDSFSSGTHAATCVIFQNYSGTKRLLVLSNMDQGTTSGKIHIVDRDTLQITGTFGTTMSVYNLRALDSDGTYIYGSFGTDSSNRYRRYTSSGGSYSDISRQSTFSNHNGYGPQPTYPDSSSTVNGKFKSDAYYNAAAFVSSTNVYAYDYGGSYEYGHFHIGGTSFGSALSQVLLIDNRGSGKDLALSQVGDAYANGSYIFYGTSYSTGNGYHYISNSMNGMKSKYDSNFHDITNPSSYRVGGGPEGKGILFNGNMYGSNNTYVPLAYEKSSGTGTALKIVKSSNPGGTSTTISTGGTMRLKKQTGASTYADLELQSVCTDDERYIYGTDSSGMLYKFYKFNSF